MTQLEIARRQGYLDDLSDAEALSSEIRRMLNSLLALTSTLLALLLPQAAEAYYIEETLTLTKGWNAVMLESTPSNSFCSVFFEGLPVDRAYTLEEIRNLVETQFAENGELKAAPPMRTLVWQSEYANDDNVSTLQDLRGGVCYFIHATNAAIRTFLGIPTPPEFSWYRVINNTNEYLNVAGVFLNPSAKTVNAKTYFGNGGPFYSEDSSEVSKLAVYTFGSKTAVDPVTKKETDELMLLPVTSKNLAPGKAYALSSAQTLKYWPGVIGFEDQPPVFSPTTLIARQGIRNMSKSERTFKVAFEAGKGGVEFITNLCVSTISRATCDPEPPWSEPVTTTFTTNITVSAESTYYLWLKCDVAKLDSEKSYGVVMSVADVTAGDKSSGMRVRRPIYVFRGDKSSQTADISGLWAGTITLDKVSSVSNTNLPPFTAAGAMTANVLVFVPTNQAAAAELVQQVILGAFDDGEGGTSNVLYRTAGLVPENAENLKGVRRISTAMMSTESANVVNATNFFGFGKTCVFKWKVGPKAKDHPYRHAWHPDHDGKTADYSSDAPNGDVMENYRGGQVKPELWTIENQLTLDWDDGKASANGSMHKGDVTWVVTGLTGPGKKLVSTGRFELKRVLTNRSIVEK